MKLNWKHYSIAVIILIFAGFLIKFLYFSGRSASRLLGKSARQILHIKNMDPNGFISISFDKRGENTVKDVTFKATDGYVYTSEYMDMSPFGGTIRWVPYGEGSDIVQSRSLSRWFGDVVNLEIPKKCKKILGVDITYAQKGERTKNLTCLTLEGHVISKEYREGLIDRFFEGYLEIKPKS